MPTERSKNWIGLAQPWVQIPKLLTSILFRIQIESIFLISSENAGIRFDNDFNGD